MVTASNLMKLFSFHIKHIE